jgi:hypothetical protein
MILGLIGVVIALGVNIAYSGVHDALRLGGDKTISHSHGFIGLFLILIGLVGAILAIPSATVAAALMVIAAIGLFFIVKVYAVVASILFLVAAGLAYMDRNPRAATT